MRTGSKFGATPSGAYYVKQRQSVRLYQ